METQEMINGLVARSRAAQKVVENYTQEQVDDIAKMFAKVVFDNAEELAKMAAEESRMGVYEDKDCSGGQIFSVKSSEIVTVSGLLRISSVSPA